MRGAFAQFGWYHGKIRPILSEASIFNFIGAVIMEWTGLNQLREKYLSFFESKGHLRIPSFPLIPQSDNSLLLINAGMAPLKKYFTD